MHSHANLHLNERIHTGSLLNLTEEISMYTWPYGEDTITYGDYIWITKMEKKMETSIVYGGYIV